MSINQWMDKQSVVYPYNGTLFSNKRNEMCKMNKPQKHHTKCNKSDITDHKFYNFTYMNYPEKANPERQKLH